ncbi:MAG: restriction endonuclease [Anaerolineaceae bacterium]
MTLTKTTNRLHFTDLEPFRFEDLCLNLIYPLKPWLDIRHYGRTGGDEGIDIFGQEKLENGSIRRWFIQCRRYKKATKSSLFRAVNDTLRNSLSLPDVLLVIVACDVRRKSHEDFIEYAKQKGVSQPILWTQSILEAKLFSERKDLLFAYFGLSDVLQIRQQESTIQHNLQLKKRMRIELQKESYDPDVILWQPYLRFMNSKFVIHSIDDSTYPNVIENSVGLSSWFVVEPYDFYFNGIEVVLGMIEVLIDNDGRWAQYKIDETYDGQKYTKINVFHIGRIPYKNIIEYDNEGDEYYRSPHIYCNFADEGTPYESFRFEAYEMKKYGQLDPTKQFTMSL